jgi:16S rRNA processing protein RimM
LNGISKSGWVPLARLLRPQGRRGELLAEPLSNLPDIFAANHDVVLVAPSATSPTPDSPTLHIEEHWFPTGKNAGRIVLKLSGCDSISDAEALAGKQLLIAAGQLPTLDPDTFFVGDLVGCVVYNADISIGTIVDVEFATGPDGHTRLEDVAPLLAVELILPTPPPAEIPEPVLIPFVRAWLESVDIAGRRITMHLPEGLLDSPENPQ